MRPTAPRSFDFEVDHPPRVGTVVTYHGQRYEAVGLEPHVNRAGRDITLIVWRSHCARCAEPFDFRTTVTAKWPNRRCAECKSPGSAA